MYGETLVSVLGGLPQGTLPGGIGETPTAQCHQGEGSRVQKRAVLGAWGLGQRPLTSSLEPDASPVCCAGASGRGGEHWASVCALGWEGGAQALWALCWPSPVLQTRWAAQGPAGLQEQPAGTFSALC